MRFPSKTTPYDRSIIPYFPRIADALSSGDAEPMAVYVKIELKDKTINDYLDALDCLFALGKIELTEGGLLRNAG
ncbi:MAG: hypothetical protein II777_00830 [Clostridia bacterium]|nr:hypothetical protein [Clostridia bacterium]